jgi:hypothetical protein
MILNLEPYECSSHHTIFSYQPLKYYPDIDALVVQFYSILGFPTKILYVVLISLMHSTCPAHLILPDLMTLIIFDE